MCLGDRRRLAGEILQEEQQGILREARRRRRVSNDHWCGPLNTNVRQGSRIINIAMVRVSLPPPFPSPPSISAPSSSSTLIKNSYILISRGCVVPHIVAIDVPGFSPRSRSRKCFLREKSRYYFQIFRHIFRCHIYFYNESFLQEIQLTDMN